MTDGFDDVVTAAVEVVTAVDVITAVDVVTAVEVVTAVDVSVDGGRNWTQARLEGPVLAKCLTRFNADFVWDGKPAIFQSRAVDETGQIQPTYGELRKVRASRSIYHNNAIQGWKVAADGGVHNANA